MNEAIRTSLDQHYVGVSPQLLARVRQNWSAMCIDLDLIWRDAVRGMPGFCEPRNFSGYPDSRPMDLLLLFDQACCWVDAVHHAVRTLRENPDPDGRLHPAQVQGLAAVFGRLREQLAGVRALATAGLAMPAMQLARSISEDVDLALLFLVRRKPAMLFVDCATPEDAAEFWRRHVSGGRAFRSVAQALYRFGLDYSNDSDYARWRKEVLVFLGSFVHTSYVSAASSQGLDDDQINPAAFECLYFSTIRIQEMCAYSLVLGDDFQADIAGFKGSDTPSKHRLQLVRQGGGIIVDQMRWLTDCEDNGPRPAPWVVH